MSDINKQQTKNAEANTHFAIYKLFNYKLAWF